MVYKGEIIVAMDPDLRDMYYCEVVRGDEENLRNILCRVLSMAQYPIQHAVLDGSIPNENPPIPEGAKCRLQFVRRVDTPDAAHHNYTLSVSRCLDAYARQRRILYDALRNVPDVLRRAKCPDPAEFDILERHRSGDYRARRAIIDH